VSSIILWCLAGCPAESLGIELPPGGAEAISAEDLRRDVGILRQDGRSGFTARMRQMNANEQDGCVARGEGTPVLLSAPADDLLGQAALISLAKGLDTSESTLAVRFCVGTEGQRVAVDVPTVAGGDPDWKAAEAAVRAAYLALAR
jgi:hypothetical protein